MDTDSGLLPFGIQPVSSSIVQSRLTAWQAVNILANILRNKISIASYLPLISITTMHIRDIGDYKLAIDTKTCD